MTDYLTVAEVLAMHAAPMASGIKVWWKPLSTGRRPVITLT
jgi:hypothetical protein